MSDWFDERANRFLEDRNGCPNDRWTLKSECAHCIAELLRESKDKVLSEVDDIFGADSRYYQQIKSRLEDL